MKYIIYISVILILFPFFSSTIINSMDFKEFAIKRAEYINHKCVKYHPKLNSNDVATNKQITDRINSLIYWSKYFNYIYPQVHFIRVIKDMMAIVEYETGWINWSSIKQQGQRYGILDNGQSFGIWSLNWNTVYWIAEVNNWHLNETEISNNTHQQTKYAVWYFYHQLQNKGGDRLTAIIAYNTPGVKTVEEKWRNYGFQIWGRIAYHDFLIKQKVNEYKNWWD
jgi:hypothetical protein